MALKALLLLQEYEIVERMEFLKIISRSQSNQGKTLAAEQTMRKAIRTIVRSVRKTASLGPEIINVLEV
jgi:hypothetical protein